jgi:hypothetical protein
VKHPLLSSASSQPSPALDGNGLPAYVDKRAAAAIVTQRFFPVSHRSLERWPLRFRVVNRRAVVATAELLAVAKARFDAAPEVMRGEKAAA